MEKLCQAFENGKELVELSQASPHDISNVLKLYLRQVGRDGGPGPSMRLARTGRGRQAGAAAADPTDLSPAAA